MYICIYGCAGFHKGEEIFDKADEHADYDHEAEYCDMCTEHNELTNSDRGCHRHAAGIAAKKVLHAQGVAERRESRKVDKIAGNKARKRNKADVAEANRSMERAQCRACRPGAACDKHAKNARMSKKYYDKWTRWGLL